MKWYLKRLRNGSTISSSGRDRGKVPEGRGEEEEVVGVARQVGCPELAVGVLGGCG